MQADRLNSRSCGAIRDRPEPSAAHNQHPRPRLYASPNGIPVQAAHKRVPLVAERPRPGAEVAEGSKPQEAAGSKRREVAGNSPQAAADNNRAEAADSNRADSNTGRSPRRSRRWLLPQG